MEKLIESYYNDYDILDKSEEEIAMLRDIESLTRQLQESLNDEQLCLLDCLETRKADLEKYKAKMFAKALINYTLKL